MSTSAQAARDTRLDVKGRNAFWADLLLWFVWVPASLIVLFFMLENFLLSDTLF